jgi:predicted PurR-regulated permease PerM
MDQVVGHWIRGQVQVALILAVLYGVGLTLAGVKLGAVIGIMTGLLNVVPYFGAAVGICLSVLMVLIEQGGWQGLLPVAAVFLTVQLLEGYVITPRLVGEKVGMAPVTVIIVLLVGGKLFGLVGMLFAVPVTAAMTVLLQDALRGYQASKFFKSGAPLRPPVVEEVAAEVEPVP